MILADTSAWVEYLRGTGSKVHQRLETLIQHDEPLVTTDVVVMELLAGSRDDARRDQLRRLLYRFELRPIGGLATYERAAELSRLCRRKGTTIRQLTDCLIATVALRDGASVLHHDRDFDAIARHCGLRIAAP